MLTCNEWLKPEYGPNKTKNKVDILTNPGNYFLMQLIDFLSLEIKM